MSKVHPVRVSTYLSQEYIERKIYIIRGKRVMLDSDLAILYGVSLKNLNRQVVRNLKRFPPDFMVQLTKEEFLRCQIGTFGGSQKGSRKYLPYVFTEQGVAMLSGVLHSDRAIRANIEIMRAFTKLRELILSHKDLQRKIEDMENKYDKQFQSIFEAIKKLLEPPSVTRRPIGFHSK